MPGSTENLLDAFTFESLSFAYVSVKKVRDRRAISLGAIMACSDLLSIVEAIYEIEDRPEKAWLRGVAKTCQDVLGTKAGAYGLTYDVSNPSTFESSNLSLVGVTNPNLARVIEEDCRNFYERHPDVAQKVFRSVDYAESSDLPLSSDHRSEFLRRFEAAGLHGILGLNGIDVDGRGAHIGVLLERPREDTAGDSLSRVAIHLSSSHRLRRRLGDAPFVDAADAILEPSGKIVHADRGAKLKKARMNLKEAAVRIDRLRGALRRRDPERALAAWRALVDGRWSLVDHFESDGKRYVLAQRNDLALGPFELLSERERQVVALAALGHANKMIGYELGISVSTVGVLLSRATRKVGARSRGELIEAWRTCAERGR